MFAHIHETMSMVLSRTVNTLKENFIPAFLLASVMYMYTIFNL